MDDPSPCSFKRIGKAKMKLVLLGANGRTGAHVLREALARGATVTAVVRSPGKCPDFRHDRLRVVIGDPCDGGFLSAVFRGQDAVISTLGGRRPTKKATSVYPASADAIVEAAWATGLKKVVVTSSALLFPADRPMDRLLKTLVGNVVRSAARMEKILGSTKLDVAVARCGFLTNAGETRYRAMAGALPDGGSSVSRQSLAQFLVDTVQGSWSGYCVYGVSAPAERHA